MGQLNFMLCCLPCVDQYPSVPAVDYVRVYVQDDYGGVGCSPAHRPTQKYINDHIDVYSEYAEYFSDVVA